MSFCIMTLLHDPGEGHTVDPFIHDNRLSCSCLYMRNVGMSVWDVKGTWEAQIGKIPAINQASMTLKKYVGTQRVIHTEHKDSLKQRGFLCCALLEGHHCILQFK
ncbi:hypothetical protein CHARACLAT_005136 [Characodon lateralis]|uniref:Uncharacterized protein n=1 Tax=Characodon lateralis TaxID=208331 RepID=A0ABU7F0A4_9TELE|nr:hypothetical protein [Characodon lateralis]